MNKTQIMKETKEVISTTKFERNNLIEKRKNGTITRADLEISKTVISANKNIVSALVVAKGLMQNGENN